MSNDGWNLIDAYKPLDKCRFVKNKDDWEVCPDCGEKPRVWIFDNGEYADCKCCKDLYEHGASSVSVESICEHMRKNNGSTLNYDGDLLRKEWNKAQTKKKG